jgi:hypothetical protein
MIRVTIGFEIHFFHFYKSFSQELKVPKCEIFDPFFYTNKSYMGRWLEDWRIFLFFSKTTADIRHFVFFAHAEPAIKKGLRRLSLRLKNVYTGWAHACSACFNSDTSSIDTNSSSDDRNKQQQGWQQQHDHPQQQERKQQQT